MNKKLRNKLETTIRIAECLLAGQLFHVHNSEIDQVPVPVMTKTAAAKKGLVLKRGAKRVAIWDFQIGGTSARGGGDLYLASSFKPKEPSVMTPTAFTSATIWQGASIRPQQGQRFYALHKGNIDRPANYVEVAWVDTETRQGEQIAILLTQTGERLEWAFSDTMYRSHRQMTVASSITLPVELNPAQIKAAISALPLSDQSPDRDAIVVQNVWSAIKQHGGTA